MPDDEAMLFRIKENRIWIRDQSDLIESLNGLFDTGAL